MTRPGWLTRSNALISAIAVLLLSYGLVKELAAGGTVAWMVGVWSGVIGLGILEWERQTR